MSVGYVVLMHARVAIQTPDDPFLDSFSETVQKLPSTS
jgi:hypothetical protein